MIHLLQNVLGRFPLTNYPMLQSRPKV